MNVRELKKIVASIPESKDECNVWLGVDGGEGYTPADSAFIGNSLHMPLDGDDLSDKEHEYTTALAAQKLVEKEGAVIAPECLPIASPEEEVSVYKDIFVIGDWSSENEYKSRLGLFVNRDSIKRALTKQKIFDIQEEMAKKQVELESLRKELDNMKQ